MRTILLSALVSLGTLASAAAQAAPVAPPAAPPVANAALLAQAQKDYADRDFSNAGSASAQAAADAYAQLVTLTTDPKLKAQYLVAESSAIFFVGTATSNTDTQKAKFQQGETLADTACHLLGIPDVTNVSAAAITQLKSMAPADLATLGDALYQRGANLGKWGEANGVLDSLGKWPELRDNMNLIISLGMASIHDYGPYRVLGYGYYKVPGVFGGDTQKGEKYLQAAVKATLAPGQIYSINGTNNNYLAEILNNDNQSTAAKALLNAFIKADPNTLNPALIPETKQAIQDAINLLKNM